MDGVRAGGILIIESGSSAQPVADAEDNHGANPEQRVYCPAGEAAKAATSVEFTGTGPLTFIEGGIYGSYPPVVRRSIAFQF